MGNIGRIVKDTMKEKKKAKKRTDTVTLGGRTAVITKPTARHSETKFGGTDIRAESAFHPLEPVTRGWLRRAIVRHAHERRPRRDTGPDREQRDARGTKEN